MAKGKEARSTIKLKSEASDHCYFTQKNRNNSKERLQLRKFDPVARKHVMYKEASKV
ncbi:MAG: 50S ribosomal protein L33 [Planctomycetaceae bacterium]|nr:50S ribosomal protein L33 [Planctomycetaceae bacterium]